VVESEPVAASTTVVDAFAQASGALGFAPVVDDEPADSVPDAEESVPVGATPASDHVAPRRHRVAKRLVAAGASLGVMTVAGFMAVSMTLPASAVAAAQGGAAPVASLVAADAQKPSAKVPHDEIQAFVASSGVKDEALARSDEYSTVSLIDVAAEENIRFSDSLYTNDPEAAIQWPFMVGVAMSSPYGMRNGRMHAGIDLVPGNGATIQAIADGTVRIATESGGAYGVTAYVDHVIDGKVVTSHYAHMQHGSLAVKAGQKVKVGDTIGKVGNTGRSYGAHLHFEIIINGSTVNPLDWMRKNAGRSSY
jgi:murein DD-endopeptidase MepM/ murein hydrolase activator NlpD